MAGVLWVWAWIRLGIGGFGFDLGVGDLQVLGPACTGYWDWELRTENYDLGALAKHFITHSRYYGMEVDGL